MNTETSTQPLKLVTVIGLRQSGIFPEGSVPCVRTLRYWTRRRTLPHICVGRRVYYDLAVVVAHLLNNLSIPAR